MALFPTLKTSAIAQYPATRVVTFQNQILRFVDGTEQRYRDGASSLHEWVIRLSKLDEYEMVALETFFQSNQGRFGNFSFTDPWDNRTYGNCSFASDEIVLTSVEEMRGATFIKVKENRT